MASIVLAGHALSVLSEAIVLGESLILSDLHLGLEDQFAESGHGFLFSSAEAIVEGILGLEAPARELILNGDIIDDFALRNPRSRRAIERSLIALGTKFEVLTLLKGNHDVMLATLPLPENAQISSYALRESILIMHGDRLPDELESLRFDAMIIGHEHPCVQLSDTLRSERFKCFLLGTSRIGNRTFSVLVMPAAHPEVLGTAVHEGAFMSPVLKGADLGQMRVYVAHNGVLDFGTLNDMKFTAE